MLRPVLACMWIEKGLGVPPIEFEKLCEKLIPEGSLRRQITELKRKKKDGIEMDAAPPIEEISEFIITQMEKFGEATKETQFTKEWGPLDELFRNTLVRVNGIEIEQAAGGDRPPSLLAELRRARARSAPQL